jgi:hypothetical protein
MIAPSSDRSVGVAPAAQTGRPAAVETAFWLTAAQAVAGSLTWMTAGAQVGLLDTTASADRVLFAVLCLVGTGAHLAWLVLGWQVRRGDLVARGTFAVFSGFGLAWSVFASLSGWLVPPLIGVVLLAAILILLFQPTSNAWFRAVSPEPGPGSPRR